MGRIHLFEFEDLKWFPQSFRNYMTDFLRFIYLKTKIYDPAVPVLEELLVKTGMKKIVDLGSGGGGGLIFISNQLKDRFPGLKILLTDLFPNKEAFEFVKSTSDSIDSYEIPVDARNVPKDLKGVRTMFLSFHHFKPHDAKAILQDAVDAGCPIAIFETQERTFRSILSRVFTPVTVFIVTPFIKPFRAGRIFFTYIIPATPFFMMWDGIVSSLRTYSVKEMNDMIRDLENSDTYTWETARITSGQGLIIYLTGTKKEH